MATFIIWDMQTRDLRLMLEFLPEPYTVPGLSPGGGALAWQVFDKGIRQADRVVAFLDLPNANVGFELGFAFGCDGKPVALVETRQGNREGWETRPPLAGLLHTVVRRFQDLRDLPQEIFTPGPVWKPGGDITLFLCPGGGPSGSALVYDTRASFPEWRYLSQQGWNLVSMPERLRDVGAVVWVITDYAEGADVRDGAENAGNAIVAGFTYARGANLTVLRHESARRVVDVEAQERVFKGKSDFRDLLKEVAQRSAQVKPSTAGAIDYRPYLEEKLQGFVGRDWLAAKVDNFLDINDRGYVVIEALPGMGKSTFAARLVRRSGWPHHFNSRTLGLTSVSQFLDNLWAQLVTEYQLDIPKPASRDLNNGIYVRALFDAAAKAAVQRGQRATIVIDALDEAVPPPLGAQPLFLPPTLPSGLRVLVTLRSESPLKFIADGPVLPLTIDPKAPENRDDIVAFLRASANGVLSILLQQHAVEASAFVEKAAQASEGNFMYVRALVNDLLSHPGTSPSPGDLPHGLVEYYEWHWTQLRSSTPADTWVKERLPVLRVLAATDKPVTLDEMRMIIGFGIPSFAQLSILAVRDSVDRWGQFLIQEPGPDGPRYQLYHPSFREFLRTKEEIQGGKTVEETHRWISEALLARFRGQP